MSTSQEPVTEQSLDARRHHRKSAKRTPQQYARAVDKLANRSDAGSLLPYPQLRSLSRYLQQPFESRTWQQLPAPVDTTSIQPREYISIYDLNPDTDRRECHFSSVPDFEARADELAEAGNHGHIVFMRGHPSPEWLNAVGVKYDVDPLFFQDHLQLSASPLQYFDAPTLPSARSTAAKLRIVTIGGSVIDFEEYPDRQKRIDSLREGIENKLRRHRSLVGSTESTFDVGDSIIRECCVLDTRHFTIEQDLSIWTTRVGMSWAAIVWLDIGETLEQGPASFAFPLRSAAEPWRIQLLPTIQHDPEHTSKARARRRGGDESFGSFTQGMTQRQSASLLHLNYGQDLDPRHADCCAFYALTNIFKFAAFSESQFLNLLKDKVCRELSPRSLALGKTLTLANLLSYQQILERHIDWLRQCTLAVGKENASHWPVTSGNCSDDDLQVAFCKDYEALLAAAEQLETKCRQGMQALQNNASIIESKKGIVQAEEVTKLTQLAFFFVPLSYLASLFGMNMKEFNTGRVSLWVWALASMCALVFSAVLLQHGWRSRLRRIYKLCMDQLKPGETSEFDLKSNANNLDRLPAAI